MESCRTSKLVAKLQRFASFSPDDEEQLLQLVGNVRHYPRGSTLVAEGSAPLTLLAVQTGWAVREKQLVDGRQQIMSLLLPGDLSEPFGIVPPFMSHSIRALTDVEVSLIDLQALRLAAEQSSTLGRALWWDLLVTQNTAYERAVTLGCYGAAERLGHLFCELHHRLESVDLVENDRYDLPLTQSEIGEVLGLSAVHVNRSLQTLRATGMLSLSAGHLTIHNLRALEDASHFDPTYLLSESEFAARAEVGELSA